MVKHIVMWNLKDSAGDKTKAQNLEEMKIRLESLKQKIETVDYLEVGINFNDTQDAYDIVLYSEFRDREGLDVYQKHPEHIKARDFIRKVRLYKKVVDYEI
jgi:hypothetical protein